MAKKEVVKQAYLEGLPSVVMNDIPVVYADRIVSFSLGSAVCKLVLGSEVITKETKPQQVIVLPTQNLLEAIEFITTQIYENKVVNEGIEKSLNDFLVRLHNKAGSQ